MDGDRTRGSTPAGPRRWAFQKYLLADHASPFGHRFQVHTPAKELVAVGRRKRGEDAYVFFSDENEQEELFRLAPKKVRLYARTYEVVDAHSGQAVGELRKREYKALGKEEWLLFGADGEQVGMVVEAPPERSVLKKLNPLYAFFGRAWQMHWGQQIVGQIQPQPSILGDRLLLDLGLDKKGEFDRRLALAVAACISAETRKKERAKPASSKAS